jgi:hypothetical protein
MRFALVLLKIAVTMFLTSVLLAAYIYLNKPNMVVVPDHVKLDGRKYIVYGEKILDTNARPVLKEVYYKKKKQK